MSKKDGRQLKYDRNQRIKRDRKQEAEQEFDKTLRSMRSYGFSLGRW